MACSSPELLHQAVERLSSAASDGLAAWPAPATAPPPAPGAPTGAPDAPPYQTQVVDAFLRSPGNEVTFLPTGLGELAVVDAIARGMLDRHPSKHVLVCVIRPAQALSHAERLRASLGVPVGA